jgi:hypothetical protein
MEPEVERLEQGAKGRVPKVREFPIDTERMLKMQAAT